MISRACRWTASALLVFAMWAAPVAGQGSIGIGTEFLGYTFSDGLGAEAAQLLLVPVAIRIPAGSAVMFDVYSAWAQAHVERNGSQLELTGVVDTRVKASIQATPWAMISVGANLPTGNPKHTGEEALVASILATDLLGFSESTFGSGTAITSSVATAARIGGFGVGVGGAYSARGEFEPSSEIDSLRYTPGSETRLRMGIDRNFGNSTFTAGGTFITYTDDQANGRNLFQAGNRLRFDATYAFRASGGVWTLYAADLIREEGELTLQIVDDFGGPVGDTLVTTAKQNLLVAGMVGTVALGGGFVFRPRLDFKYQTRSEPDGSDRGSGWLVAAGADIPLRLFGVSEFFPKARVLYGSIRDLTGNPVNVIGMEFKGTIRWTF